MELVFLMIRSLPGRKEGAFLAEEMTEAKHRGKKGDGTENSMTVPEKTKNRATI